ncbi:MAG: hypothetical protein H6Q84_108 [Deltaproteobacteria bacterium]|nr:hypothetical protein [Deltaproteobacteria bacterium]
MLIYIQQEKRVDDLNWKGEENMKEHIQLFLLSVLGSVCFLVAVLYPMEKFASLLLLVIYMSGVGIYAKCNKENDVIRSKTH